MKGFVNLYFVRSVIIMCNHHDIKCNHLTLNTTSSVVNLTTLLILNIVDGTIYNKINTKKIWG